MHRIGVGVLGAGLWGETHVKTYSAHPFVDLIGICDVDGNKAMNLAGVYGARKATDNVEDILDDSSIHAVSIATPDFAHFKLAMQAAKAGKHILVEKPLAMTVEECEQILQVAKSSDVILMVDFHNRWNPVFARARDAIVAGEIGDPLLFNVRLNDALFVPMEMLSWASRTTVAWFVGSHTADLVRFLFDDEVQRVFAVKRERLLRAKGIQTADFYEAILELSKGGVAVMENCWILPNKTPNLVDFRAELIGSAGALYMDLSHHRALERYTEKDAGFQDVLVMPRVQGQYVGFAYESIRHFVDCVLQGRTPLASGWDGLQATKIVLAIEKSAESGQPVNLE